jgi:CMP-N-acetylneuraminic acid synthetase
MNKQKIVALLPMKANSERVKGKNFREFNGKPLFRWILDTLLSVDDIDCVIINTDAREILAKKGLVETDKIIIRDRKPEICGDMVSMNLIIEDDLQNVDADIYLMTHATNPLMTKNTVQTALNEFQDKSSHNEVDSLFTVNKIQTRFYREDCSTVNHDPDNLFRTQDLEPWFEENSNLYIFTKQSFAKANARIGTKPMMFESPKFESIDIDTLDDWNFAVTVGGHLLNKGK